MKEVLCIALGFLLWFAVTDPPAIGRWWHEVVSGFESPDHLTKGS